MQTSFTEAHFLFIFPQLPLTVPFLGPFHCPWIPWLYLTNIPTSSNVFIGNAFVPIWNLLFFDEGTHPIVIFSEQEGPLVSQSYP